MNQQFFKFFFLQIVLHFFLFLARWTFQQVKENPAYQRLAEAKRKTGYVTVNGTMQIWMILNKDAQLDHIISFVRQK